MFQQYANGPGFSVNDMVSAVSEQERCTKGRDVRGGLKHINGTSYTGIKQQNINEPGRTSRVYSTG